MMALRRLMLAAGSGAAIEYLDQLAVAPLCVWSIRKLVSSATTAIRVRRSSDNAEQDIGFTAKNLDAAALLTFAGSGDAFVSKFYDQTGNGHDMLQATAAAQPKIVSAGVANAMIEFDGVNDAFGTAGSVPTDTPWVGIYGRMRLQSVGIGIVIESSANYNSFDGSFSQYTWPSDSPGMHAAYNQLDNRAAFPITTGTEAAFSLLYDKSIPKPTSADIRCWQGGGEVPQVRRVNRDINVPTFLAHRIYLGARAGTSTFALLGLRSVALYKADTSAIRSQIEALVNG